MNKLLFFVLMGLLIHTVPAYAQSNGVVSLEADNAVFLALKDTAQAKLPVFIGSIEKNSLDSNYVYIIKSDFVEGIQHEHMWTQAMRYKNGLFYGVLIDTPVVVKKLKPGQKVSIKKEDVEDWVIYDNAEHTQTGGFSEKFLESKLQTKVGE